MRSGDHMDRGEFTDALGSRRTCICRGFHRTDITAHHHGYESATDILTADEGHIRGFDHGIGGFDRADQTFGLHHSKSYHGNIYGHSRTLLLLNSFRLDIGCQRRTRNGSVFEIRVLTEQESNAPDFGSSTAGGADSAVTSLIPTALAGQSLLPGHLYSWQVLARVRNMSCR